MKLEWSIFNYVINTLKIKNFAELDKKDTIVYNNLKILR